MDEQGLLLCARYSAAPNFFGYCGPDENKSLVDHLKERVGDKEVTSILSEFETLYQYLVFIARENKIADPFDRQVVEAYWIGNPLLQTVSRSDYVALLKERLLMEKRIGPKKTQSLSRKIFQSNFYPHHSFHVFNIFKRTGHDSSEHTVQTMDECRIGWGRIVQSSKFKVQSDSAKLKTSNIIIVVAQPLEINAERLRLGQPAMRKLKIDYKGKLFLQDLKIGEWVSFHWGFVCDRLTQQQVRNLPYYTQKAIEFYNQK